MPGSDYTGFKSDSEWQDRLSPLTERDRKVLAKKNKKRRFNLSIVYAVASRCRFGYPQVLLCMPFGGEGPFPTAFWLTCTYLEKRCSGLESAQQVPKLEEMLVSRSDEVAKWHGEYALLRAGMIDEETKERLSKKNVSLLRSVLDKGAGGIDHIKNPGAAKCLHMHVAAWIGMRRHPASGWLEERLGANLDCGKEYCRKYIE